MFPDSEIASMVLFWITAVDEFRQCQATASLPRYAKCIPKLGHLRVWYLLEEDSVRQASAMWIGWNEFDILLGDVRSLKAKRSIVRPIVAEIKRRFAISVAEVEDVSLYRRTRLGVSMVSGDRNQIEETLNKVEALIANRPEIELLAAKMRFVHSSDF